ncbi:hypothetical protein RRG08_057589 [Elysia crispata]|uniref:Uncharacterized protein n=1 Tax=Elysia crispata TaxID=231223 RepID=A0AAE0ZCR2_9GAST|nr:hypothetical protein RRG08_057589 [Elysia crispata]
MPTSYYFFTGRNLALKQHTNQSSTFEPWHSSHAVDGKLDIPDHISSQAATCTRTKEGDTGWWGLTFSQPVDVYMFRIYNRINSERMDSSKDGLGAVLLQEGKPIEFASRALTETEKR